MKSGFPGSFGSVVSSEIVSLAPDWIAHLLRSSQSLKSNTLVLFYDDFFNPFIFKDFFKTISSVLDVISSISDVDGACGRSAEH